MQRAVRHPSLVDSKSLLFTEVRRLVCCIELFAEVRNGHVNLPLWLDLLDLFAQHLFLDLGHPVGSHLHGPLEIALIVLEQPNLLFRELLVHQGQ